MKVPVVHAVTNDEVLLRTDFIEAATGVMEALGERGAVQLRSRWLPVRRLWEMATRLVEIQAASHCWIVVNDRLDVALATGARGVQLTHRSLSVTEARAAIGRARLGEPTRLGASVHSPEEAAAAGRDGADWCTVGHVHDTPSHPEDPARGVELVESVARSAVVPVVAIGGVMPHMVGELRSAGAYGVAAIRGIWDAPDVAAAAGAYLSSYDAYGGLR